jgi:CheY-like chemotaxis protein
VLLADDEEDVRGVVLAMLETLGYEVIEARDGLEAVEIFRHRAAEIDLVILDLVMPRLTGEAALSQIRRIAPAVPAILISGYDQSDRIGEIVAGGFGGFLQKPFRRQDLGKKVRELLGLSDGLTAE